MKEKEGIEETVQILHPQWVAKILPNQLWHQLDYFKQMRNKGHIEIESFGRRLLGWNGFGQQESVLGFSAFACENILCPLHSLTPWSSGSAWRNQFLRSLQQNPEILLVYLREILKGFFFFWWVKLFGVWGAEIWWQICMGSCFYPHPRKWVG